jgi:nitric oxide reductase subunit B
VILLIAAIACHGLAPRCGEREDDPVPPKADPLFRLKPTPSMLATRKYFLW